ASAPSFMVFSLPLEWNASVYPSLNWLALALLIVSLGLWKYAHERSRLRSAWGMLSLWLAVGVSSFLPPEWLPSSNLVREVSRALILLATVQVATVVVFDFILRKVHLPKFVSEIVLVAGYIAVLFAMLYHLGVNVSGIFATSAVATAVVGLALQDMLSNIASGIALEIESDFRLGDYIKVGDTPGGWVRHKRLRHTSIETPDGEVILLPNSFMTRSPVRVVPPKHRHFIPFNMPYSINPQEVIDAVVFALCASPI